jgi:phosphoribosyl-ATP pyrophosphohydrolase
MSLGKRADLAIGIALSGGLMGKPTKKKSPAPASKAREGKATKLQKAGQAFEINFDPAKQLKARSKLKPISPSASPEVLNRLWCRRNANPDLSHSARLLSRGAQRIAQKLGEEAVECLIEVMAGNRSGTVSESADLLYHLLVTWVYAGIRPEEIWEELQTRESVSYSSRGVHGALKRLLGSANIGTTKIP